MKQVFLIPAENKAKVENLVRGDDLISRQSIVIRSVESLGLSKKFENGYFLIIDGSEDALKRADEILKDLCKQIEKNDEIINKIKEDEDKAIEGFGGILG